MENLTQPHQHSVTLQRKESFPGQKQHTQTYMVAECIKSHQKGVNTDKVHLQSSDLRNALLLLVSVGDEWDKHVSTWIFWKKWEQHVVLFKHYFLQAVGNLVSAQKSLRFPLITVCLYTAVGVLLAPFRRWVTLWDTDTAVFISMNQSCYVEQLVSTKSLQPSLLPLCSAI